MTWLKRDLGKQSSNVDIDLTPQNATSDQRPLCLQHEFLYDIKTNKYGKPLNEKGTGLTDKYRRVHEVFQLSIHCDLWRRICQTFLLIVFLNSEIVPSF